MQWAECGSLDDFIALRVGRGSSIGAQNADPGSSVEDIQSRSDRIRAFRSRKVDPASSTKGPTGPWRETKAVRLLGGDELRSLFGDIVNGLAFLVGPIMSNLTSSSVH